jgi:hypothetical protein
MGRRHTPCGAAVPPLELSRIRRYSKRELLGSLYVDYVMSVTDVGLTPKANAGAVVFDSSGAGGLLASVLCSIGPRQIAWSWH